MARQRFIWPDLWTDPVIGRLPPEQMVFFIGCFSNADDEGRLLGDPAYLRSTIFPYQDYKLVEVAAIRDAVAAQVPTFHSYEVENKPYLIFLKWADYQKPKYPRPSKIPPPPGKKPRKVLRKRSGKPSETMAEDSGNVPETSTPREGLGGEGFKSSSLQGSTVVSYAGNGLPKNYKEELILKLLNAIGADADEGTLPVVSSYAKKLPEAGIAKVLESVARSRARNRAEYAVKALASECAERGIS